MSIDIPVKLEPDAILPVYQTEHSAGMDLRSTVDVTLTPGERRLVPTGLRMSIPEGYEGQVRPRSGLALKHGIGMVNAPGTIDSDYRGEIGVLLINLGQETVTFQKGERIAQLVICPIARARLLPMDELEQTVRGAGGFGSTGKE